MLAEYILRLQHRPW